MKQSASRFYYLRRPCRVTAPFFLAALWVGAAAQSYAGLLISPTFDSSIASDPNSATIESTINQAINVYQSKFTDPINVTINFRSMNSGLGSSNTWLYKIGYQQFINQLTADKTTSDDNTALAHLPTGFINPVNGSTTINVKTANLRAIGITGLNSGLAGGVDGIVGLNTRITDIGSPGTIGLYSLLATAEHEIDEVLGLGSDLPGGGFFNDPAPQDLFRYTATGARTFISIGDDAYFSIDGVTNLARFNQGNNAGGDYGDWWSNNGGGNPGPNPPTQVQDAFAFPFRHPVVGLELRALDVIGYNLVPEPASVTLFAMGMACLVCCNRRRLAPRWRLRQEGNRSAEQREYRLAGPLNYAARFLAACGCGRTRRSAATPSSGRAPVGSRRSTSGRLGRDSRIVAVWPTPPHLRPYGLQRDRRGFVMAAAPVC